MGRTRQPKDEAEVSVKLRLDQISHNGGVSLTSAAITLVNRPNLGLAGDLVSGNSDVATAEREGQLNRVR